MPRHFIDWFWRDRHTGRIVVAQWPNLWLWLFVIASLVQRSIDTAGPIGMSARVASTGFLVIWAGDEVLRGANPWRRCLGAAVLIGSAVRAVV